jgi:formylglycine-generating enzyme required for sulfatase activity
MSKSLVFYFTLIAPVFAFCYLDPIEDKLNKAKVEFDNEYDLYKKSVFTHFDQLEELARKNGSKARVDQIKKERLAFETLGELPKNIPPILSLKFLTIRSNLEKSYKIAIQDFTKIKKDDEAESAENELNFLKKTLVFPEKIQNKKIMKPLGLKFKSLDNFPFSEETAKEAQNTLAKLLNRKVEETIDLGNDINLEMILIPSGRFLMGIPKSDKLSTIHQRQNYPQHAVTLTKPFYIGKYEVTQEQWEAVMGDNPSVLKGGKLPITNVSWDDFQKFIKNLNAKTNGGYRLPTEAEWEYACRAGTTTVYSFGDKITPEDANYVESKIGKPVAVGGYKPNAFGLYDMHGNVFEHCLDWNNGYKGIAEVDPFGKEKGQIDTHALRGGCFEESPDKLYLSSYGNHRTQSSEPHSSYGFRLIKIK